MKIRRVGAEFLTYGQTVRQTWRS